MRTACHGLMSMHNLEASICVSFRSLLLAGVPNMLRAPSMLELSSHTSCKADLHGMKLMACPDFQQEIVIQTVV